MRTSFADFRMLVLALAGCVGESEADDASPAPSKSPPKSESKAIEPGPWEALCTEPPSELLSLDKTYIDVFTGVTAPGLDYLELRAASPDPNPNTDWWKLTSTGLACSNAVNADACRSSLAAHRTAGGWILPGVPMMQMLARREYVVFTAGDVVGEATTIERIRELLQPIDSFRKAAVMATLGTANYLHFDCREPNHVRAIGSGWEVLAESGHGCGTQDPVERLRLRVGRNGEVSEASVHETVRLDHKMLPSCSYGRAPTGLRPSAVTPQSADDLGSHFADAARLEAASAIAFDRIVEELKRFNAPPLLVAMAHQSAGDERRHTEIMSNLARRFNREPIAACVEPATARTLFDLAVENAAEGCVRETYGALVASHQSANASDKNIREAMAIIAEDEIRHAWFSLQLHDWAKTRLTPLEITKLDSAQAIARTKLASSLDHSSLSPAHRLQAGMPATQEAHELMSSLFAALID